MTMKASIISLCTLCCSLALPAIAAEERPANVSDVDFGTFTPSDDGAFVEIKVNRGLISMAARVAEESEPEMARILGGLKSIRVNVMEFDDAKKDDIKSRVEAIRSRLDTREWERVVTVREDNQDVGIYAKLKGEESIEGIVVTVIDKQQAVLIHVDGSIRPEELAQVGERLNLEPLKHLGDLGGHKQK